jgi:hypothetical protein
MPETPWLARWQQRDDDELLYASLSDDPRQEQDCWEPMPFPYVPLSYQIPRTGPLVFWPSYERYLEQRPRDASTDGLL